MRRPRLSTSTGHLSSMPSMEPLRTSPWHTETVADSPSCVGRPPQPPPSRLCTTKRRFVSGCTPKKTTAPPSSPWCPAGTLSGIAGASAVTIASTTVGTIALQPDIGAGKRAIMMFPSGIIDIERAEGALVDRLQRRRQRLVGDACARERAGVDRRAPLAGAARQVDRHVAALDDDLGVDPDRLAQS